MNIFLNLEKESGIYAKDAQMYLQSSNYRKGKILTVAMEVNEDYRSYREFSSGRKP